MSEKAYVNIQNSSGRSLDGVIMWHTSLPPGPGDLTLDQAIIAQKNVQNGVVLNGIAPLATGSPTDYWTMSVLFEGDGTYYLMCGDTFSATKEFEVADESIITFTIPEYTAGTTNQSDISISYSNGDGATAKLLNQDVVVAIDITETIVEQLAKLLAG